MRRLPANRRYRSNSRKRERTDVSSDNQSAITRAVVNRRDVDPIVDIYREVVKNSSGRIVFLAGSPYSGRSDTLLAIGERLSRENPHPISINGSCTEGHYVPLKVSYEKESALIGETIDLSVKVLSKITPGVGELADFALQMIKTGMAAKSAMGAGSNTIYSPDDLKELIRFGAQTGPLVLLIDDIDQARNHWLLDLFREMAPEISRMRLLLILTLEGPAELAERDPSSPDESEPEVIKRVRGFLKRGIAVWKSVHPLSRSEVASWIGPAQTGIVEHLHGITGGYPKRIHRLLSDWEMRNVVSRDDRTGEWQWASAQRPPLNIVKDVIHARLKRLFDPADAEAIEEVCDWLAYGALEGRTFTASVVSRAANCDEDELIDTIDDVLLWDRESNPDGLLLETQSIALAGQETLWRYRFAEYFHWQALTEYGFTREQLIDSRQNMIRALHETYEPETEHVAGTLARLYREIGAKDQAGHFQRIADFRIPREQIRDNALRLIEVDKDDWNTWDLRQTTRFLLEAVQLMMPLCPYEETLSVAGESYRLAQKTNSRYEMAFASLYCGHLLLDLGDHSAAYDCYTRTLTISAEIGDRLLESAGSAGLALIYYSQGRYEEAEPLLKRALAIREKALGAEHPSTVKTRNNLVGLYREQGKVLEAEELERRGAV